VHRFKPLSRVRLGTQRDQAAVNQPRVADNTVEQGKRVQVRRKVYADQFGQFDIEIIDRLVQPGQLDNLDSLVRVNTGHLLYLGIQFSIGGY
jgi:hypothetical protein